MLARALPLGAWGDAATPDWDLVRSAVVITVAAALLIALIPTVSLWRGDLRGVLGSARTGGFEARSARLENGLVVAEVAFAVLITSGAALLARSVANLYAIDSGVRTEGVAVVDVVIRDRQLQTVNELTAALAELPGVRSAASVQNLPLRGGGYNMPLTVEGRSDLRGMTTEFRVVTPGYLESMGITLREGRTISDADGSGVERVVVINEALAKKYFPGTNPIGQRLGDGAGSPARVVGVVANAAERYLTDAAQPVRYAADAQMPWVDEAQSLVLLAVSGVDETSLLEPARRTIQRVAPGVAVQQTTTMRRRARHGDRAGASRRGVAVASDCTRTHVGRRWDLWRGCTLRGAPAARVGDPHRVGASGFSHCRPCGEPCRIARDGRNRDRRVRRRDAGTRAVFPALWRGRDRRRRVRCSRDGAAGCRNARRVHSRVARGDD